MTDPLSEFRLDGDVAVAIFDLNNAAIALKTLRPRA